MASRIIRSRPLPDSPSDPRVTDLSAPLIPPSPATSFEFDSFENRNQTATTPFQLTANVSTRALPRNPRRSGLLIQNLDTTADLNFSLGNDLQGSGLRVTPGGSVLFDFTTPPDEVYLFATANIRAAVLEITRGFSPPKPKPKK